MIFSIDQHTQDKALYHAAKGLWWSYRDVYNSVIREQESLGSASKALVFNFCRNDEDSVFLYLAAFEAGHAVALLDDTLATEFKANLIGLYQPEFIASRTSIPCPGYEAVREWLWRRTEPCGGSLHPDLSLLLSTSGSTGSPKFVRLTRRNVEANAASICETLAIKPSDRAITTLPMHYSYGLSVLNTHLLAGASVVLTDEGLLTAGFWESFRTLECTSLAGVPYSYQILNRLDPDRLNIPSLHTMTQAGGKLHNDLIAKFSAWMARRGGRFFVMYGQTEASPRIATLPSDALPAKLGSVGPPLAGGRVAIEVDGKLTTEPRRTGELVYSGPNVMMGYATCRADLALGDVLGGELHTGDMAYLDEQGYIYMAGRSQRDAKLFGLRINLDEVENMLRVHGPTAVVSRDEKLCIYCEYGDEESFAQYRQELARRLKVHYAAFAFERVSKLPTTTSGKIDYQSLAGRS
jgi:acyl-CoA synthetase (AMP-forming)/AMP-acid ligase II